MKARAACGCAVSMLLAVSSVVSGADATLEMVATTAFVQVKTTDGSGHVTYRVGGVFAARNDPGRRLSFTIICEPKQPAATLSLLIVQQGASVSPKADPMPVTLSVDDVQGRPALPAQREIQGKIAAYSIADAGVARAAVLSLRHGKSLRLDL